MLIEASIGACRDCSSSRSLVVVSDAAILKGLDQHYRSPVAAGEIALGFGLECSNELRARFRKASLFCLRASPERA